MSEQATLENEASAQNGVKRMVFAVIAMALEIVFIVFVNVYFAEHAEWFAIGTRIVGALLVLLLFNDTRPSAVKMIWIVFIMALPVFGIVFFLLNGLNVTSFKMRRRTSVLRDHGNVSSNRISCR